MARWKAGKMLEAWQVRMAELDRYARQGRADAQGKAVQIREASQGKCERQGRADSRGKTGKLR
jgi:hypothetical protein